MSGLRFHVRRVGDFLWLRVYYGGRIVCAVARRMGDRWWLEIEDPRRRRACEESTRR